MSDKLLGMCSDSAHFKLLCNYYWYVTVYGVHYQALVQATNMMWCIQKVVVSRQFESHNNAYTHDNFEIYTSIVPVYECTKQALYRDIREGLPERRGDQTVLGAFPLSPPRQRRLLHNIAPHSKTWYGRIASSTMNDIQQTTTYKLYFFSWITYPPYIFFCKDIDFV